MKKKKELIIILGSLLVVVLSVTLAYFTTEIFGTGKDISLDSANLKITFSSGSGNISSSNIEPGWSSGVNSFTVKNESSGVYKYNIVIKNLVYSLLILSKLSHSIFCLRCIIQDNATVIINISAASKIHLPYPFSLM